MLEKQNIIEIDLDDLHISTENPRTKIVIDEIQAIHEIVYEQGDKIIGLIKSIIEDGWIVGDLPAVYFENKKYIVYEGNRRISSLKCFFNPQLLPLKNKTSDKFKKYISTFSENEIKKLRLNFKKIPVILHESKDIIYKYMEKRHTPNNGRGDTLERWNTVSNERFKNEIMGKKTLVYAIYNEFTELFKNIEIDQFPMTTLDRVLKNPTSKERLRFNFKNDILIVEDKSFFIKQLQQIVDDIYKKKIDSRKLSKSEKISDYIKGITDNNVNKNGLMKSNDKKDNLREKQEYSQLELESCSKKEDKKSKTTGEHNNEHNGELSTIDHMQGNKKTKISIPKGLLFSYLETTTVDVNNPDNFGILYIVDELKNLSKNGDYKRYPISTTMLVRNLLEQSLKYQIIKIGEWENFTIQENKKKQNNKEPGLESIINYCNGNTNKIFFNDFKTQRAFRTFASNTGTKEYFDMLVHHPESVIADYSILEKIAKTGLFRVIYNILNA